jgi:outer membrane protein insertion porin family
LKFSKSEHLSSEEDSFIGWGLMFRLFVFVLLVSQSAFPRDPAPRLIGAVEIKGNKKIESAAILQKIKSQAGSLLSPDVVREDIRSVFSLGYFESVDVFEDEAQGGNVKLIFEVKEYPTISKIDYQGLDALDKDDIKEQIVQKEYEVLDRAKLQSSVEKLQQKYEEKGYYLADIRTEIVPDNKRNEAKVIFHVEENDKIQVKKINIIGNKVISAEDLKKVMQTKEGGPFSWMTGSGSYREAVFERDIASMGFYYGTMGYVRARFGKPEVTVSPDKKWIYITFSVEEGAQYFVGKIDFTGELLFSRNELNEDLQLIEGEVFNTETLRRETLKYTDKYADLGYAFANVVPQFNFDDEAKTVGVNFEVDRGEKVYIGKITVTSNTRSKDKVVRRELQIHEGELFNGTRKRESRENVLRLGYFDSVEFHQSTSKDKPNVVDIEVKVKERSTGQLMISAGYSTGDAGFIASAQLSQNNFLGNGQTASLMAQMMTGRKQYEFSLNFQEPYVGHSLWSLGGSLYQLRREPAMPDMPVSTYREVRTGLETKLGHPIFDYTQMFLAYKLEHSWVDPSTIIDQDIISKRSVNGYSSGVTASLVYDKRDDRFDPRKGLYWSLSEEYTGLGGDRKYLKTSANVKYFHPLFWDFIFRINGTAANVAATTGEPVPTNELFALGGLYSLRGYDFLTVGPEASIGVGPNGINALSPDAQRIHREEVAKGNPGLLGRKVVIGGHNQAYVNAEIEFPLLKEARIRGVLFFDAGNAWDDIDRIRGAKVKMDIGWGFRWFTPIGPLRFEFGYPINEGGDTKFQFTIGPPF